MKNRLIELLESKTCRNNLCKPKCGECECVPLLDKDVEMIADHLLANGVIVPPCKVGSKVYYFTQEPLCLSVQENTVYEAEVVRITTNRLGTSLVIQIYNEYGCTELPSINKWGKTLFLTREEAEQALKRKDEGKND